MQRNPAGFRAYIDAIRRKYFDTGFEHGIRPVRRHRHVFIRNAHYGRRTPEVGRQQHEPSSGGADQQPSSGGGRGSAGNGHYPEFGRHHGYGGGLCQCGNHESEPGRRHYYGRQYRHHHHRLDRVHEPVGRGAGAFKPHILGAVSAGRGRFCHAVCQEAEGKSWWGWVFCLSG